VDLTFEIAEGFRQTIGMWSFSGTAAWIPTS